MISRPHKTTFLAFIMVLDTPAFLAPYYFGLSAVWTLKSDKIILADEIYPAGRAYYLHVEPLQILPIKWEYI